MKKVFIVSDMIEKVKVCKEYEAKTERQLKEIYAKLFQPIIDLYVLCEKCMIWPVQMKHKDIIIKSNHDTIYAYYYRLFIYYCKKKVLEISCWEDEYISYIIYLEEYDWAIQEAIILMEERLRESIDKITYKADLGIANYELNKDKQYIFMHRK